MNLDKTWHPFTLPYENYGIVMGFTLTGLGVLQILYLAGMMGDHIITRLMWQSETIGFIMVLIGHWGFLYGGTYIIGPIFERLYKDDDQLFLRSGDYRRIFFEHHMPFNSPFSWLYYLLPMTFQFGLVVILRYAVVLFIRLFYRDYYYGDEPHVFPDVIYLLNGPSEEYQDIYYPIFDPLGENYE